MIECGSRHAAVEPTKKITWWVIGLKTILITLAVAAIAVGVACGGGDEEEPDPRTKNDLVDERFECEAARLRRAGMLVSDSTVGGWQWEGYFQAETQSWEVLMRLRDFYCIKPTPPPR